MKSAGAEFRAHATFARDRAPALVAWPHLERVDQTRRSKIPHNNITPAPHQYSTSRLPQHCTFTVEYRSNANYSPIIATPDHGDYSRTLMQHSLPATILRSSPHAAFPTVTDACLSIGMQIRPRLMCWHDRHTPEPLSMVSMGRLYVESSAPVETSGVVHEEDRLGS
jgi:hypothetical protein